MAVSCTILDKEMTTLCQQTAKNTYLLIQGLLDLLPSPTAVFLKKGV